MGNEDDSSRDLISIIRTVVACVAAFAVLVLLDFGHWYLSDDACLDRGGRWNHSSDTCELPAGSGQP